MAGQVTSSFSRVHRRFHAVGGSLAQERPILSNFILSHNKLVKTDLALHPISRCYEELLCSSTHQHAADSADTITVIRLRDSLDALQ